MKAGKFKYITGDYGPYLLGYTAIAEYLGISTRTCQRLGRELREAGVLRTEYLGAPRKKVVAAHKSILDLWIMLKTKKDGGITSSSRSGKKHGQFGKKGYDKEYEKRRG